MSPATRLGAALLCLALGLAACGGDDDTAPARASTSTTAPTSTTTTTTSTTIAACPPVADLGDALDVREVDGDVDGDGASDAIRSYRTEDDRWSVQVELAAGGGHDLEVIAARGPSVGVLGGADADRDDADEIWVRTGAGASAIILGLITLDACTLEPVTLGGGPIELPVGGSVGSSAGLECDAEVDPDAHLTAFRLTLVAGSEGDYEVTATEYTLDGAILVEGATTAGTTNVNDSAFGRYTGFTCGDLAR